MLACSVDSYVRHVEFDIDNSVKRVTKRFFERLIILQLIYEFGKRAMADEGVPLRYFVFLVEDFLSNV